MNSPRSIRRYDRAVLRALMLSGFNEKRQGVMVSGRTSDDDVVAIVYQSAISLAFPAIASNQQCISFVERNLDALRGVVNGKLNAGRPTKGGAGGGWSDAALFVEIGADDLARSRRWLIP